MSPRLTGNDTLEGYLITFTSNLYPWPYLHNNYWKVLINVDAGGWWLDLTFSWFPLVDFLASIKLRMNPQKLEGVMKGNVDTLRATISPFLKFYCCLVSLHSNSLFYFYDNEIWPWSDFSFFFFFLLCSVKFRLFETNLLFHLSLI